MVGRLVGWGAGAGLPISAAEYLWSHPSGGRLAPKHSRSPRAQRLFRPLLMSHWPKRVMWPRPAPRDGGAGSLWMGGCSHTAKGYAPWVEGWSRDLEGGRGGGRVTSRRALGRKWGLLSPACTKPNQSRGQGRLRGGSGPQGGGPLSPSAHPPVLHPLSQRLWPGEPGGGHARPRPGSPALACPGGVSLGTELSELSRTCRAAAWCAAAGAQSTRAAARGEGGSVSRRGRLESLVCGEGRLRAEPALALDGPGCPGGKW